MRESEVGIGIYKSVNSGKSLYAINNGLNNIDDFDVDAIIINPIDTNILLAATLGGIFKSLDGGENWFKTLSHLSSDVEYVVDNPQVVYAATNKGVLSRLHNFTLSNHCGKGVTIPKSLPKYGHIRVNTIFLMQDSKCFYKTGCAFVKNQYNIIIRCYFSNTF